MSHPVTRGATTLLAWTDQHGLDQKRPNAVPSKARRVVMRRLQIPQGGYSIYRSPLFPPTSLFEPVREGWKQYVAEKRALGNPTTQTLSGLALRAWNSPNSRNGPSLAAMTGWSRG